MVSTYIFNTDVLEDKELFDKYFELMPEYRKEKILRITGENKKLSLGAGILTKLFAGEEISFNEHSKPLSPLMEFNVSHSGKYAVISTGAKPVGVDIQLFKRGIRNIAHRFFTVEECIEIDQSPTPDTSFIKLWALKEAFIKCIGMGFGYELNKFSIEASPYEIKISQNYDSKNYYFKVYDIEGYQLAVCSEEDLFAKSPIDITENIVNFDLQNLPT